MLHEMTAPTLPVQLPTSSLVTVPVGFQSRSVVIGQTRDGEVVVRNRRSWRAAGAVLGPQVYLLPQFFRPSLGQSWTLWVGLGLLAAMFALAVAVGRTGGLFRLWFGPRSWGRRGLLRSKVFAPAVAATAHATKAGKQYKVLVRDSRYKSVTLATVYEQESANALVDMLRDYASRVEQQRNDVQPTRG